MGFLTRYMVGIRRPWFSLNLTARCSTAAQTQCHTYASSFEDYLLLGAVTHPSLSATLFPLLKERSRVAVDLKLT